MKDNTQNPSRSRDAYHHGDLPQTLIHEAAKLLAEKGAEQFSMREVARRAGVAVAAPAHHFGNAKGLLTAIATYGFKKLTEKQEASIAGFSDPIQRVICLCKTYVEMSSVYPGYAAVMFRWDLVDQGNEPYKIASNTSFNLLKHSISMAVSPQVPADSIGHAANTLWAAMHGFVTLSLSEREESRERIEFAVRAVLTGMQSARSG